MPIPLPAHVQWLLDHRGNALRTALDRARTGLHPIPALRTLMAADPSPGHHAVQWLADGLIGGRYRWEDVAGGRDSKVAETLGWFAQHRAALPTGQRNLEDHADLASLYRAVQPYLEREVVDGNAADAGTGGRAARRAQRTQAYQDSIIVYDGPDMVVAVPLSRRAGQWWGRGTRWCTAADGHNMFEEYNNEAPLIVIAPRAAGDGSTMGKLQLYLEPDGGFQFMDAADSSVEPWFVQEHWSALGPLISWAAERSPRLLGHVPPQYRTRELCSIAVKTNGNMLRDVPGIHVDQDMCLMAVGGNGMMLEYVPVHLRTPQVCMAAVRQNGLALDYLPAHLRTPELCLAAVSSSSYILAQIPPPQRSADICMAAVVNGASIILVPDELRTRELVCAAMTGEGHNLGRINPADQDRELCLLAVRHRGVALARVRADLIDADIAMAAVQSYPAALCHVPKELLGPDICRRAVLGDGGALEYVPRSLRTRELCEMAVSLDGYAIGFVPEALRDEAMCLLAVEQNPWVVTTLGDLATHAVLVSAITSHPDVCMDIDQVDPELIVACVPENGLALEYVPTLLRTLELCVAAVSNTLDAMEHVPPGLVQAVQAALPLDTSADTIADRQWQPEMALAGLAARLVAGMTTDGMPAPGGQPGL